MHSASRAAHTAVPRRAPLLRALGVAGCVAVLGAGSAGCETTQEKAAKQQARSEHILKAREERRKEKKKQRGKSETQHEEGKKG